MFWDDPCSNKTGILKDNYDSLVHIYTKKQNETYVTLNGWSKLMDDHSNRKKSDTKLTFTKVYITHDPIKYYNADFNVPFNFMFINQLHNKSEAVDYKTLIDKWVRTVPEGSASNWVIGNHDNHRVATRFGHGRADDVMMMSMVMPGILVIYNDDKIGTVDRKFTYAETMNSASCSVMGLVPR